jgi:hypothetical protein
MSAGLRTENDAGAELDAAGGDIPGQGAAMGYDWGPESRIDDITTGSADALPAIPNPEWISRRIHDGIGHRLTLLGFQARLRSAEEADLGQPSPWSGVAAAVDAIFEELYGLLEEITRGRPDEGTRGGLGDFVEQARAYGVDLDFQGGPVLDDMDDRYARLIDAVCREAVANALKHGGCGPIRIRLARGSCDDLAVTVSSPLSPRAIAAVSGGHGLELLRGRLAVFGGRLWTSIQGDRHLLGAWLPLASPDGVGEADLLPQAAAG